MAELRDVIRRLELGHGVRDIHRSTGVHRTIARQLREFALELGWLEADCLLPTEEAIEERRSRSEHASGVHRCSSSCRPITKTYSGGTNRSTP
jgi:hypothetical protein